MPSHRSGGTPPEIPEQFRDAYRRAYEQAMGPAEPEVTGPATEYRTGRPAWFFPAAVVAGALLLVGCAYVLGRMVSGGDDAAPPPVEASAPAPSDAAEASPEPAGSPTPTTEPTSGPTPYDGEVAPVQPDGAEVGCTSKPSVDASGREVRYGAGNLVDGEPTTAWRCDGRAIGERLVFELPEGTEIAEVGLVPGYAKTDAESGVDRYAENNRITRVTWILADGTEVEQRMSADPDDRSMRTIRVPATAGDEVTLRIDQVRRGERNTTMISEVRLATPVR